MRAPRHPVPPPPRPATARRGRQTTAALLLTATLGVLAPSAGWARRSKPIVVGLLADGPPPPSLLRLLERTKKEAQLLLARTRPIIFPQRWERIGDWSAETAQRSAEELLASRAVDLVLAMGPLSTAVMAGQATLSKPVLAPLALDPRFSGLPERQGKSGKRNFSYLVYQANFAEDIKAFQQLVKADAIYLIHDETVLRAFPRLEQMALRATQAVGARLVGVGVSDSAEQALQRIPAAARAVFVTPLHRMSSQAKRTLYAGLKARKLPSFSTAGRPELELGAMATQTRGVDYLRIARRTALNIERTVRGQNPATFPIHLRRDPRLIINMQTAAAVGFSPTWETLVYAELENEHVTAPGAARLTLAQAMREAVARNWDVLAAREGLYTGKQQIRRARSQLLPQLGFSFEHQTVRPEVADASFGSLPRHQGKLAAQLSQFVYIEPALANLTIQRHGLRAREAGVEAVKLNIVAQTAAAYLDLLRAQTTARIQKNNALLTAEYLESATIRRKLGASGPSDVYRWESQIAVDRSRAITARAEVRAAQAQLGQLVRRPQGAPLLVEAPSATDPTLVPRHRDLERYLETPQHLRVFSSFMVQEGIDAAPELQQLSATIAAQRRSLLSRKRALYLPQLRLQGELSYVPYRQLGEGGFSDISLPLPDGSTFEFPATDQPRLSWFVGGALTLPLFTGMQQTAERWQALHELRQLERQQESAKLKIETRIRAAVARARASSAAIRLARASATAAAKNLKVISDAYDSGVANTVTLLDAQNNALVTQLAAATTVFDFLRAIVELQRASGRFELFVAANERQGWFDRLARHFAKNHQAVASGGSK